MIGSLPDSELRALTVRLSLLTRNPIDWFLRLPLRELGEWAETITEELDRMRED